MIRVLIGLVAVLVLVLVAVVLALPHAAPPLIVWQLRSLGLEASAIGHAEIGTDEAVLDDVRLAPAVRARRLTLAYAPLDLIRGRLGTLAIEGLRVEARVNRDEGLVLEGLPIGGGEGGSGPALPLVPDLIRLDDAVLDLALPDGRLVLEADASLDVVAGGPDRFEVQIGRITAALEQGTVNGSLTAAGEVEPLADDPLATLEAHGTARLAASGLDLGKVDIGALSTSLDLALDDAVLTVEVENVTARLDRAEPAGVLTAVGGAWPVELTVPEANDGLIVLDLQRRSGRLSLPVDVRAGGPSAGLRLDVRVDASGETEPLAFEDLTLALDLHDLLVGPRIDRLRLELAGAGTANEASLAGRMTVAAGGETGRFAIGDLQLNLPIAVEVDPERVEVAVAEPGGLRVAELVVSPADAQARLRLALPAGPALELERTAGLPWRIDLPLQLEELEASAADTVVRADAGAVRISATGRAAEPDAVDVQLADGALTLPGAEIGLQGLAAELTLTPDLEPGPVTFRVERVRSLASPAVFAPFAVKGVVRPEPDRVRFESTFEQPGVELEVAGVRRFDPPTGQASVELEPVRFDPEGLQPADLLPVVAGLVEQVAGAV
ncbi:MAG: hypothetical protein R3349_04115, partial [Geminicoccaceae bacterium]|nr:hypothetical protein [Geminicoccaceae bacterium]